MRIKQQNYIKESLMTIMCNPLSIQTVSGMFDSYDLWLKDVAKNEGTAKALEVAKAVALIALNVTVNAPITPVPFRKSNKKGIPKVLNPLMPYLTGSPEEKRLGLTIVNTYKRYYLPPSPDTEAITSPGPDPWGVLDKSEFNSFLEHWKLSLTIPKIVPGRWLESGKKSGPNGPALLTAHLDAVAIIQANLWDDLMTFSRYTATSGKLAIVTRLTEYDGDYVPKPSKLAHLSEPGGKTRTIAIGDYFSQLVLKPFHDQLMEILRSLKTDGTWNQDDAAMRVKATATHPCFSFDLSKATDRFPAELTRHTLTLILGEELSRTWMNIMTNRDFSDNKQVVRYGVGQPMGFYSSWAAFAFSHHALIKYLAWLKGFRTFESYEILGDDVVIWEREVALSYQSTMKQLGVEINLSKSLQSDDNNLRIEFAKRLFLNGVEITPVGYKLLKICDSLYSLPLLISDLKRKGWVSTADGYDLIPGSHKPKTLWLLFLLSKGPAGRDIKIPVPEVEDALLAKVTSDSFWNRVRVKYLHIRAVDLEARAERIQDDSAKLPELIRRYSKGGGLFVENVLASIDAGTPSHPAPFVLRDIEEKIHKVQSTLHNFRATEVDLVDLLPQVIEYVPLPLDDNLSRDNRIMEQHLAAKTWLQACFAILSEGDAPEAKPPSRPQNLDDDGAVRRPPPPIPTKVDDDDYEVFGG